MIEFIFLTLSCLLLKHLVIDFIIQGPYIYENKGTFGHLGGILHAFEHALGTLGTFLLVDLLLPQIAITWPTLVTLAVIDMVLHYFIDYFKVNICQRYEWRATTSPYFWWMTGIDQYLHMMTYIGLIAMLM